MAPDRVPCCPRDRGFPRPRGDGPCFSAFAVSVFTVPPPTRGWPRQGPSCGDRIPGSPAHAGMAPLAATPGGLGKRFPRPRGDGPDSAKGAEVLVMVPPPTRGWPPSGAQSAPAPPGSPAHAGMAPACSSRIWCSGGFPRPRGDGPGAGLKFALGKISATRQKDALAQNCTRDYTKSKVKPKGFAKSAA